MSKQTYRVCFCFRRRFKLAVAEAPEEIKGFFDRYSENGLMSADHLRRFLIEVQKQENATLEDAQAAINSLHELKHLNILHHHKGQSLNLETFFKYLFGDINPPVDLQCGVHHDMSAPLSHYFIYTGHNSYLTGNQLSSDCSDVPIIHALQRGVRVIELDIWPNSNKDGIEVLHGRTLTTPVELIKCLRSIKEHAFTASDYPVVITLEDHLTPDLQAKVAEMVTSTFGDILFCPNSDCLKEFPSPESLKKRIIISTKPPKEYMSAAVPKDAQEGDSLNGKTASDEEAWGKEVPHLKGPASGNDKEEPEEDEDDEEDPDEGLNRSQKSLAPEYRRLIAIHAGKPKGGMSECLKVDPEKVRRLSLSEQQLEKVAETRGTDIVRSLWLMHGMFKSNGGCGYVKKPDFLLKSGPNNEVFDPRAKLPVKKTLKVRIYMGEGWYYDFRHTHFDQYSPPDFYTRVGIAGVPADVVMKKTKTLEDNWIPVWNEEFEFQLTVPELALLRLEVHEYDIEPEGVYRKQHSFSDSDSDSDRSQAGESNSVLSNSIFKFYFELTATSVSPSPHDLSKIQSRPRHRHLPFFLLMPCMPGAHPPVRSHLVLRFPPPASTSSTSSASNHGLARPPISPPLAPNVPLCGDSCDKLLSCGFHRCHERCHRGQCAETCRMVVFKSCRCGGLKKEVCGKRLRCKNHRCPSPCHRHDLLGPCAPCPVMVPISRACGQHDLRFLVEQRRTKSLLNVENYVKFLLCAGMGHTSRKLPNCTHLCPETCHPGQCSSPDKCSKKVTVRCQCQTLKKEWLCKDVQEAHCVAGSDPKDVSKKHFGLRLLPCNSDCKAKIQVVEQELHLRTSKDAKEKDGPTEAQPSRRRKRRQRLQEANQLSTLQKILPAVKKLLLVVILVVTLIAASYYGYKGLMWLSDYMNEGEKQRRGTKRRHPRI
ncbi:unnamed protein product [Linum tenue]|uniref:Phosphoinositide phospholipase C n=1 Tax=Linum tenue TaxID=586396 RepID=A0AAV0K179_9ROSI|nr:unnamed protein product [Linum tenue]